MKCSTVPRNIHVMTRVMLAAIPSRLSLYSRINFKSVRLKSRYISKHLPPANERKVWDSSDLLRIVPKAMNRNASSSAETLELCQRLQDLSYIFKDIDGCWTDLIQYDVYQVTTATHSLLAEGKGLTGENLLEGLNNPVLPFCSGTLSTRSSREQHISILTALLTSCQATEKLLVDFREKLIHYELSERMFIDECIHAIYAARLLLGHLGTSADSVIQEYNCLLAVDVYLLLEQLQKVRAFGINKPNEIVNYTLGVYMRPPLRGLKSYSTRAVLQLLDLSNDEADSLAFSKDVIQLILHSLNMETIEGTYAYLLNSGYTRLDIAKVPFILAFSARQIREFLEDASNPAMAEFSQLVAKTEKLNFLGRSLDELYGSRMASFCDWGQRN